MTASRDTKGGRYTVVFPQGLYELTQDWAEAEGRSLGSVLTFALETGIRSLMSQGLIPPSAVQRYYETCTQRLADADEAAE